MRRSVAGTSAIDPIALYFSANLFFLNFAARNLAELTGAEVLAVLAYGHGFFVLELAGLWLLSRLVPPLSLGRTAFVAALLNVVFFLFRPIHAQLSLFLESFEISTGASLGYLILALLAAALAFSWGRFRVARLLAAVVFPVACALPLVDLGAWAVTRLTESGGATTVRFASPVAPGAGDSAAEQPNVYYLMLDAYAGAATLDADFGFDNRPFLEAMTQRGFFDAHNARSAYSSTFLTFAGVLLLDYPATEETPRFDERTGFYPNLLKQPGKVVLFEAFRNLGYRIGHADNDIAPCAGAEDFCVSSVDRRFVGYLEEEILASTPLGLILRKTGLFGLYDAEAGLSSISSIGAALDSIAAEAPFFLFAHHLPPHPPYAFKPDCSLQDSYDYRFQSWEPKYRPNYIDNLQCSNRQILELTQRILARDPNAIVVVESDHGPGFNVDWSAQSSAWSVAAIRERMGLVNLILAPQRCRDWLYPEMNQINTARFVLACARNRPPDYLPDRSFISPYPGKGPGFGTVTEIR